MKNKMLTYPLLPREYSIQKSLLGANSREKEVLLIDKIIKLDSDFQSFLFSGIYNPEGESGRILKEILYLNNYQNIKSIISTLENKIKYGYDNSIFKEFLIRYFDFMYKNNKIELQMIIILSPPMYNSLKNILNLNSKLETLETDESDCILLNINSFIK